MTRYVDLAGLSRRELENLLLTEHGALARILAAVRSCTEPQWKVRREVERIIEEAVDRRPFVVAYRGARLRISVTSGPVGTRSVGLAGRRSTLDPSNSCPGHPTGARPGSATDPSRGIRPLRRDVPSLLGASHVRHGAPGLGRRQRAVPTRGRRSRSLLGTARSRIRWSPRH